MQLRLRPQAIIIRLSTKNAPVIYVDHVHVVWDNGASKNQIPNWLIGIACVWGNLNLCIIRHG